MSSTVPESEAAKAVQAKAAFDEHVTRVTWLTLASLLTVVLVFALNPKLDRPHFAGSLDALRVALDYPANSTLFNKWRGNLAADMIFLLAYGSLLRVSMLLSGGSKVVATCLCTGLMAADFVENAATLTLLRTMETSATAQVSTALMNVASVVKWTFAAVISGVLTGLWSRPWGVHVKPGHVASGGVVVLFAVGAVASAVTAIGYWSPGYTKLATSFAFGAPAVALAVQVMALGLPGQLLRFLVVARAPLGALLGLIAFGPLAIGPVRGLLSAILVLDGLTQLAILTAVSLIAALACGLQIIIFGRYASKRLRDTVNDTFAQSALRDATFYSCLAAGLMLPVSAFTTSYQLPVIPGVLAMIGAIVVSLVAAVRLEFAVARYSNKDTVHNTPFFVVPSLGWPALTKRLNTRKEQARPAWLTRLIAPFKARGQWVAGHITGPGYFERSKKDGSEGDVHVLPGITLAVSALGATLIFYGGLVFGKVGNDSGTTDVLVPTATSLVLLILLVSWILASATYFLDRYRVPLFTALIGFAAFTTTRCANTDHVFEVKAPGDAYDEKRPGDVLKSFAKDRPVLVAIAGGGIQAGAWGAQVLAGLDNDVFKGKLRSRVALVSAVSGGAMGALYYGAHFDSGPNKAIEQSRKPSLDQVATTLVGVDVWRVIGGLPGVDQTFDRGRALERSWEARALDGKPTGTSVPTLREWAALAGAEQPAGRFPAFLFSTTVVETGQPLAIATTSMPSAEFRKTLATEVSTKPVVESFNTMYGTLAEDGRPRDVALSMATAARMSSTFPYVSPAAAPAWPNDNPKRFHLVDGGYYDNFGLVSLTQWLDDALTQLEREGVSPKTVEIVIIRGEQNGAPTEAGSWGWARQMDAPASAFVATRSYGQWAGGSAALKLLKDRWRGKTAICDVAFSYPVEALRHAMPECSNPPLSWKLTTSNTACLDAAWGKSAAAIAALRANEEAKGACAADAATAIPQ